MEANVTTKRFSPSFHYRPRLARLSPLGLPGLLGILFRKERSCDPDCLSPEAFSGFNLRLITNLRDTEVKRQERSAAPFGPNHIASDKPGHDCSPTFPLSRPQHETQNSPVRGLPLLGYRPSQEQGKRIHAGLDLRPSQIIADTANRRLQRYDPAPPGGGELHT